MKCVSALAVFALALIPAKADVITVLSVTSVADAIAQRNAWITGNFGLAATADVTTTFESDGSGPYTSLTTGVGTFSILAGGLGSTGNGTGGNEFTILNSSDTPFSGRYNTTAGGKNWLDSNDITKLQLTTAADSLYFFITDVNDAGGNLKVQTADGSSAGFQGSKADGNMFFVGITSSNGIGSVLWLNNSTADGFALDDFGVAKYYESPVPEPASWPAAAAALLIVALAVRLRARSATPAAQSSTARRESGRPGRLR